MDHIETAILNCYGIREAEQNMVFAARLTQHGHTIQNMADLMDLYRQSYSQKTVENIAGLPHPTVQKFMVITVAVVGASRRFLAQITRHQFFRNSHCNLLARDRQFAEPQTRRIVDCMCQRRSRCVDDDQIGRAHV